MVDEHTVSERWTLCERWTEANDERRTQNERKNGEGRTFQGVYNQLWSIITIIFLSWYHYNAEYTDV